MISLENMILSKEAKYLLRTYDFSSGHIIVFKIVSCLLRKHDLLIQTYDLSKENNLFAPKESTPKTPTPAVIFLAAVTVPLMQWQ